MLEARSVSYRIGSKALIERVSLQLIPGRFLGIVGPNGAGKTTLMRLLTGFLTPSDGVVYAAGERVDRLSPARLARILAYVPQSPRSDLDFNVLEMVMMGRFAYSPGWRWRETAANRLAVRRALQAAGVEHLADRIFRTLSGGERQRVILARALAQEPRVLLLDEPTANLDPRFQLEVLETVRRLTATGRMAVAAVLHDLTLAARYCDELLLLADGRAVSWGPPEGVLRPALLRNVYGLAMSVDRHARRGHLVVLPDA